MEMNKMKFVFAFVLIFFISTIIVNAQEKNIMKYAEDSEITEFDPFYIKDAISLRIATLEFNSLVGPDVEMRLQANLLASLEPVSHSGKSYKFRLRKMQNMNGVEENVKWVSYSNDNEVIVVKEFKVEDVVYTFNQIKNSARRTCYGNVKSFFEDIKAVSGDDHLIEVLLKKENINMDITLILRNLNFPIIPYPSFQIDIENKCAKIKNRVIVSTGPYVIAEELINNYKFVKNPYYFESFRHKGNQGIGGIIMAEYPNNRTAIDDLTMPKRPRIHLIPDIDIAYYQQVKYTSNSKMEPHGSNNFTFFAYNCRGAFYDEKIRQAFTHAIDRKDLFIKIYGEIYSESRDKPMKDIEQIIHSPLPADERPIDLIPLEYDPGKARELKSQSKFDKTSITLLMHSKGEIENRICEYFKESIKENLQIEVQLLKVTSEEWLQKFGSGDFDVAFGQWTFNEDVDIIVLPI